MPPPSDHTDSAFLEELVASAASGDRGAQDELLQRYWHLIERTVRARRRRLGGKATARDETQDINQMAALKILKRLPKHEWRGRSAFVAWIKRLATMEPVDALRYNVAQQRNVGAETEWEERAAPGPVGEFTSEETRVDQRRQLDTLRQHVAMLKPEYASALIMHHMGFAHAQIGDALGCTAEAARKLVARARAKLVDMQSD